jgi:4'-phosphopantetheinyl transferase
MDINNADFYWIQPPADLDLGMNEVHVWRISLATSSRTLQQVGQVLTEEEHAKAQRYYFEKDRNHWTIARGTLRILLGKYLQTDPRTIRFGSNEYGKPHLEYPILQPPFQFNISHSGDLALYAFTRSRELGVDVEYKREIDYDELAKYSFSPQEQAKLLPLSNEQKHIAFYNCWTRKEAYIKARGMGLSLPLNLFDVSLLPEEPTALLQSREDPREVERWSMQALEPGTGYAGALAVEGTGWKLRCWQWLESQG